LYNKKEKTVDWLFPKYKSILEPQNMKSIRKIAACLALSAILERTRSEVKLAITDEKITIKITAAKQSVMPALLASTLKNFEQAFDVAVSYHIMDRAGNGKNKVKVIV
jgi:tRNA threonylcarbamoyladenosine modification (KEOPS) complex  Pcc1 subunit